jgi:hypothetical protein
MPGTFTDANSQPNGLDHAILFNGTDGLTDPGDDKFLFDINRVIDAMP